MAAVVIPPKVLGTTFFPTLPVSAGTLTVTPTAGNTGAGNYAVVTNQKTVILAINTDSGAHTVTITSVAAATDRRTGDVTAYSIAAGGVGVFGPFTTNGWAGSTPVANAVLIEADDPKVVFVHLTLP
jgi:hypothetical protein